MCAPARYAGLRVGYPEVSGTDSRPRRDRRRCVGNGERLGWHQLFVRKETAMLTAQRAWDACGDDRERPTGTTLHASHRRPDV